MTSSGRISVSSTENEHLRGATRLDLRVDVQPLKAALTQMTESEWRALGHGANWTALDLLQPDKHGGLERHSLMDDLPTLTEIINQIPSRCMDLGLARLGPDGWIKEHRDLSGGTPMGVARFHFPIITNDNVSFRVSGKEIRMREGEVWSLDTSYRHQARNDGDSARVHLIGDFEMTPAVRSMLPERDWRDQAHNVFFFGVCIAEGCKKAIRNPREGFRRMRQFFSLRFLKRSQMGPG